MMRCGSTVTRRAVTLTCAVAAMAGVTAGSAQAAGAVRAAAPMSAPGHQIGLVYASTPVPVRSAANSGASTIGLLNMGNHVGLLSGAAHGWTPVNYRGTAAWILSSAASRNRVPVRQIGLTYARTTTAVRATASYKARTLFTMRSGTRIGALGPSVRGWTPVNYRGTAAWTLTTAMTTAAPSSPTRPTRHATAAAVNAPGTTVSSRDSQQVMVADHTTGTRGTWARYEWNGTSWIRLDRRGTDSIYGRGGVVVASQRRQGTASTPAGTFGFVSAFGVGNPGTSMPYRKVTSCSWWIEDPAQSDYNRWRTSCSGAGLNTRSSERLADWTGSMYRQAAVIDYNYASPRVRYGKRSGAGIFLHYASRYTGGCVGLNSHTELDRTIAWLNPAKHPRIVVKR